MIALKAKLLDVEQGQNEVVLSDAEAQEISVDVMDRVRVRAGTRSAIAIVDLSKTLVERSEIGLYKEVSRVLKARKGQKVFLETASRPKSLEFVRKKLDGGILSDEEVRGIISDLMEEKLSNAELAAFVSGIYTRGLTTEETVALTKAIIESGGTMDCKRKPVVSEHSIGGVSGDRSSMLVVPIIASLGLTIPKTCTHAISTASATADAMEVFAPVDLTLKQAECVVRETNGCLIWGGATNIAAADDKLIRIRNPLHLDPTPLLLSSILAKKKAEGADYVLIDIPVGVGAKIEHFEEAKELGKSFEALGKHLDMEVQAIISDGSEPILDCVGPVLEARAVLEALEGRNHEALIRKACLMAGILLSAVRGVRREEGYRIALQQISSGKALKKFREIIEAQGGDPRVEAGDLRLDGVSATIRSSEEGKVAHVDNTAVSRICRALGAPLDKKAGMVLKTRKGEVIEKGDEVCVIHASSREKLRSGLEQSKKHRLVQVEKMILEVVGGSKAKR